MRIGNRSSPAWRTTLATLGVLAALLLGCSQASATYLFVSALGSGKVIPYSTDSAGAPVPITCTTSCTAPTPAAVAVTPSGRYLYVTSVANGAVDGSVSGWEIGAEGSLTKLTCAPVPSPTDCATLKQPQGIAIGPSGDFMYVANENSATISVFAIGADGSLTSVSCSGCSTGAGTHPVALAETPNGRFMYVDEDGSLSAFSVQPDGALEPLAACGTGCTSLGGGASSALAISPSGAYLYVAVVGSASIHPMSIAANGSITPIACADCGADAFETGGIAISPDGSHLYATGGAAAADITVFSIASGGALTDEPCTAPADCGGGGEPVGITVSPSGGDVYAVDYAGNALLPFMVLGDGLLDPISCGSPPADCSAGSQSDYIQTIASQPDQGPVASLTASAGAAGSPTELNASGSTASAGGQIVKYVWSFGDGAGATTSTPQVDHTYAAAGTYTATVTVTDEDGCSDTIIFTGQTAYCNGTPAATATASVSVVSPLPPPRLTHVGESNKRWRDGSKLAGISRARRSRTPVGTTFSFTLNEAARVSLTFTRTIAGRRMKSGHKTKCVTETKRNRRDRRCTLTKAAGTLSFSAREGAGKVSFDGRVKGAKRFAAGSYTVTIEATNAKGAHSAATRLSFTVLK